jgi:hypothetical protein
VHLFVRNGGPADRPNYAVVPLKYESVIYAGTAKFNTLIKRLGGQVRCLPDKIFHDFRCSGPTVDSNKWLPIQYEQKDGAKLKKLEHWISNYDINLPGKMKASWAAIKVIVKEMMASLLQIPISALSDEALNLFYSKLRSLTTRPQPPHLDYLWTVMESLLEDQELYLAVFPLNSDGMMLQVWEYPSDMVNGDSKGQLLFLPSNTILVLPGKTVHGGGFMTNATNNLRGHLYIYVNHHILKGTDLKVDYGVNENGVFQPNECLVETELVREYGVTDKNTGKFHTAVYFN